MIISENLRTILEKAGNSSLSRFIGVLGKILDWALISLNALSDRIMENEKKTKGLEERVKKLEEKNQALEVQLKYLYKEVEGDF